MNDDNRKLDVKFGTSLKPIIPADLEVQIKFKGKPLAYTISPNQVKLIEYKGFLLIVRYFVEGTVNKLKWATIDSDGNLIGEGEI